MQKWEYCILGPMKFAGTAHGMIGGFYPVLVYLQPGKPQITHKIKKQHGMEERDIVLSTIAQLGEEGWEMISSGTTSLTSGVVGAHFLYFKRPK